MSRRRKEIVIGEWSSVCLFAMVERMMYMNEQRPMTAGVINYSIMALFLLRRLHERKGADKPIPRNMAMTSFKFREKTKRKIESDLYQVDNAQAYTYFAWIMHELYGVRQIGIK